MMTTEAMENKQIIPWIPPTKSRTKAKSMFIWKHNLLLYEFPLHQPSFDNFPLRSIFFFSFWKYFALFCGMEEKDVH